MKKSILHLLICLNIAACMANGEDPDQLPHSTVSDLGLHCFLSQVCGSIVHLTKKNCYCKYNTDSDNIQTDNNKYCGRRL